MNKFIVWLMLALMATVSPGMAEQGYQHISQKEAARIIRLERDYILLDVSTEDEYEEGHIPGAINIPSKDIGTDAISELPDLDQSILVYSQTSRRSKQAAEKLADLGYTQVMEFGSIKTWDGEIISTDVEDDPFEARDYADPEDFYDDYYDDFYDYDEAEEYYYEHGGW